jgi:hypothetical protein
VKKLLGPLLLPLLALMGYAQAQPGTIPGWPLTSPKGDVEEAGVPQVRVNGRLVDQFQYVDDIRNQLIGVIVNDERDLKDIARSLTITGREQLRFQGVYDDGQISIYTFIEWIEDIMTEHQVRFEVDNKTRRVFEVGGQMQVDVGVPRTPAFSAARALWLTRACVRNNSEMRYRDPPIKFDGTHESRKLLKDGEIWWGIGLELEWSPSDGEGGTFHDVTHEWYWVRRDGTVERWMSVSCSHCRKQTVPHCAPA